MNKRLYWFSFLVSSILLLTVISKVQAQEWPPLRFDLAPKYDSENSQIIYEVSFRGRAEWQLRNVTIKVPIPEGTEFVKADSLDTTTNDFNGEEVSFFTSLLPRQRMPEAYFTVDILDPEQTVFTTTAWISWEGDQPGDYLTEEYTLDITRPSLNWQRPPEYDLQFDAEAIVSEDEIVFLMYPKHMGSMRMWDLKINVTIPEETPLLSVAAPAPFTYTATDKEIYFNNSEMEQDLELEPLKFIVSTKGLTDTESIQSHIWLNWRNVGRAVGRRVVPEEQTSMDLVVRHPRTPQRILFDAINEVPFANYDLVSTAFQADEDNLYATLQLVGNMGGAENPVNLYLYIDTDCQATTGNESRGLGAEYRFRYRHEERGRLIFQTVSPEEEDNDWTNLNIERLDTPIYGNRVVMVIPRTIFGESEQFCWRADSKNQTREFSTSPPTERLPDSGEYRISRYNISMIPKVTMPIVTAISTDDSIMDLQPQSPSLASETDTLPETAPQSIEELSGKIAIPIDNGVGAYNVHLFSIPDGTQINEFADARQPQISENGEKMLVNREGNTMIDTITEIDLSTGNEAKVSEFAADSHPFYGWSGERVVYGNDTQIGGANKNSFPAILVQCSLTSPNQEPDPRCQNITTFGVLIPAGQIGEIWGTHPVWTDTDNIVYNGCNSWAGFSSCGIYSVGSWATKGLSNGAIPVRLTDNTSDIPTDAHGSLIAFHSFREGNWEIYTVNDNNTNIRNLSNSPTSSDGLPTFSPDGNWLAFASDRDEGKWAIWVVPVRGGEAEKLFDLPDNPWAQGERDWTTERLSWGP